MQELMVVVGLLAVAALLVLGGLSFLRELRQTASPADRDICKEQTEDTSAAAFNRCLARQGVGDIDMTNLGIIIWLFAGAAAVLVLPIAVMVVRRRDRREIEEQRRHRLGNHA